MELEKKWKTNGGKLFQLFRKKLGRKKQREEKVFNERKFNWAQQMV